MSWYCNMPFLIQELCYILTLDVQWNVKVAMLIRDHANSENTIYSQERKKDKQEQKQHIIQPLDMSLFDQIKWMQ